jgi:hypothetical protein
MSATSLRSATIIRSLAVLATGLLLASSAYAGGTKYQSNLVDLPGDQGFALLKPGKLGFKSTIAVGGGGLTTQLILSNVDCPPNNDAGVIGKCGPKDTPITDHVLELGISFNGTDLDGVVGIKYFLKQGKAAFQATGKNAIGGGVFGPLVTVIFNQPLGIGIARLRTPGSNPAACNTTPLAPGNGCTDGDAYAIAGVTVGSDTGTTCTASSQCGITATCVSGACTPEPCATDAQCDQGGGVGSHQCGSGGTCCDPNVDPTCAGQVP